MKESTITIGGQPVARSVSGALGRLELAVAADADLRADVDFLRERINAVEGERDDMLLELLGYRLLGYRGSV